MARNIQSKSFVKKKRKKMFLSTVIVLLILTIVILVLSWLMGLNFLIIKDVNVFGADAQISTNIHDVVMNDLSGKYLGVFPYKNTLIYPKSEIISTIKTYFPRVLDVNISRDGLTDLRITVNEKVPSAIVCVTLPNFENDHVSITDDDPCYFTDDSGLMFEKFQTSADHSYNVYFAPDVVSDNYIGAHATSSDEFRALQSFYNGAQNSGIKGAALLIKPNGEYEFYSSSTTIYFNNSQKIMTELSNLTAFWDHMVTKIDKKKTVPIFDYIDLRYDSNVFYKIIK